MQGTPMDNKPQNGINRISELSAADRTEIKRLAEACRLHDGPSVPLQLTETAERFLRYEDGALIGCLELVGTSETEACGMVRPDRRRRGIARALLDAAREEWLERGFEEFLLACDREVNHAAAFAEAVGATYSSSEYRMELIPARMPAPANGPLQIRSVTIDDVDDFVRIEVSLGDIVEQLDIAADEFNSYLNKNTGELVGLTDESMRLAEGVHSSEDLEGYHDWQKDVIAEAFAVQFSGEFIKLPSKYDIHEYSIIERFVRSIDDDRLSDRLYRAIKGRGAFRRFGGQIRQLRIADEWFAFRKRALEQIAISWLTENDIPWRRIQPKNVPNTDS